MTARVLVAGIGNVFLGDDGFGVEVAKRLSESDVPPGVVVGDFGISGLHLAYDMLDARYDTTVFVDAVARGGEPGTLYVIDATDGPDGTEDSGVPVDAHGMHPAAVLTLLRSLGGVPGRVLVLGCEPASTAERIGLSPEVAAVVDEAVRCARELAVAALERSERDVPGDSGRGGGAHPGSAGSGEGGRERGPAVCERESAGGRPTATR